MNLNKSIILLFLFFLTRTLAQNDSDALKTGFNNDTTSISETENPYLLDSRSWAGLGLGAHFANQDKIYQRMILMLTTEYRLQYIPSFLFEFHWWNTDGGKKKSLVFSTGIKLRFYLGQINFFVLGEIGYATSFPINIPYAIGIETPVFNRLRLSIQIRQGLSNGNSAPSFLILSLLKSS